MRKFISIFVVAALLSVFLMSSAFATEDPQIVVSSVEAVGGDEVKLTVSFVNNPGITNGSVTYSFDEEHLEFVSLNTATYDAFVNGIQVVGNPNNGMVGFVSTSDFTADIVLFELTLRVKEGVGGDFNVGLTVNYIMNNAEEEIAFEVVPGVVSVHLCDPVPVEEVPATIYSEGVKAHGKCACGKLYIDGVEVTEEDLVIPMLGQMIVSSAEAYTGDEVRLTVSLVNNPGITNGMITVNCDEAGLELVKIDTASYDAFMYGIQGMSNGNRMNFVATSDVTADIELFYIVLKVKDDAAGGDYEVGLTIDYIMNNAEERVGFATFAGTVAVHACDPVAVEEVPATCIVDGVKAHDECECGKLYIDGVEVTEADLVITATGHHTMGDWYVYAPSTGTVKGEARCECQYCDYYESAELYLLGDVNHDDKVNTTDAKMIMQYELGMIDKNALDLSLADVNADGKFNTTDAKLIMQLELGMIPDFTVDKET